MAPSSRSRSRRWFFDRIYRPGLDEFSGGDDRYLAGEPLSGATITTFELPSASSYRLEYTLDDHTSSVEYEATQTSVNFVFTDAAGATRSKTYAQES